MKRNGRMFAKLIRLLADGTTRSQYDLAQEMGLSPETVEAFIEHLSRKRMLVNVEVQSGKSFCSHGCNRCFGCKGYGYVRNISREHSVTLWKLDDTTN
ncbi:MAG: hypothetical protein ACOX0D_04315 [Sphaerochaeta sp.]|jgi:biotin operon repressor